MDNTGTWALILTYRTTTFSTTLVFNNKEAAAHEFIHFMNNAELGIEWFRFESGDTTHAIRISEIVNVEMRENVNGIGQSVRRSR